MAERLLLARRLGVEIDHDGVGALAQRAGVQLAVDRRERIVERVHEQPAHDVDDEDARAGAGLEQGRAAPGRAGRIVGRAHEPRLALDEDERLALVEGVVAERDGVGAGRRRSSQIASVMPKPPAAFSPLTTTQSSRQRSRRAGQPLGHCRAAGASDDVAEEEKAHR